MVQGFVRLSNWLAAPKPIAQLKGITPSHDYYSPDSLQPIRECSFSIEVKASTTYIWHCSTTRERSKPHRPDAGWPIHVRTMTRHRESPHTSLPVRSRGSTGDDVSDNVDSQAHGGAQSIFRQSSQHFNGASQYSMYPFGSEPIVQANHEFPPAMSPEMEFPMSTQYYYEGAGEEELLSAYMTSEEAKSGDIFDVYPSMVDETFDASITDWSAMVPAPPRKNTHRISRSD